MLLHKGGFKNEPKNSKSKLYMRSLIHQCLFKTAYTIDPPFPESLTLLTLAMFYRGLKPRSRFRVSFSMRFQYGFLESLEAPPSFLTWFWGGGGQLNVACSLPLAFG